jgi:hypothetical protein
LEGLKAEPVDEKLRGYKSNSLQHATRLNIKRIPKIMLKYRPNGRRQIRSPLNRLSDEDKTGIF